MKEIAVGITEPETLEVRFVTVVDTDDPALVAAVVTKPYGYVVYVIAGAHTELDEAIDLAGQYFLEKVSRQPVTKETLQ